MQCEIGPRVLDCPGKALHLRSHNIPLKSLENIASRTSVRRPIMLADTSNGSPKTPHKIRTDSFHDVYETEQNIGRGNFAVVKKCRHKLSGHVYAAKFLRKRRRGKDCRADILREVGMLEKCVRHPCLVHIVEVFESSSELVLVTEYASGGDLYKEGIEEQEKIREGDAKRLMRQILEALVFLHERHIVHLDVKPQNILLTKPFPHGDIKLCDFGFARTVKHGDEVREIIGTPDYVAPEVLNYEPLHTATDMWSVGVLVYVMLSGCSPFKGDSDQETFMLISQVALDFPQENFVGISHEAIDFMSQLITKEPEDRMTATECLQHPWLRCSKDDLGLHRPPFGSPVGYRRALTPPNPEIVPELEPSKKCRCDGEDEVMSREVDATESMESEDQSDEVLKPGMVAMVENGLNVSIVCSVIQEESNRHEDALQQGAPVCNIVEQVSDTSVLSEATDSDELDAPSSTGPDMEQRSWDGEDSDSALEGSSLKSIESHSSIVSLATQSSVSLASPQCQHSLEIFQSCHSHTSLSQLSRSQSENKIPLAVSCHSDLDIGVYPVLAALKNNKRQHYSESHLDSVNHVNENNISTSTEMHSCLVPSRWERDCVPNIAKDADSPSSQVSGPTALVRSNKAAASEKKIYETPKKDSTTTKKAHSTPTKVVHESGQEKRLEVTGLSIVQGDCFTSEVLVVEGRSTPTKMGKRQREEESPC